jgi:hypothetical protein
MAGSCHSHKNRFKQIFADGWEDFKRNYPRYQAVDQVVQKRYCQLNPQSRIEVGGQQALRNDQGLSCEDLED